MANVDMTDPNATCPFGWNMTDYSRRSCGRSGTEERSCDSVFFPVGGEEYTRVCGKIKAYQFGVPDAFFAYFLDNTLTIDDAYVSGLSVTHSIAHLDFCMQRSGRDLRLL